MRFSIIIPTFNNFNELERCLWALSDIDRADFEVFICIDGSTDGTEERLSSFEAKFPIHIRNHPGNENRGRSATRNLCLESISGEYILFLDSDMEARKDLLDQHEKVLLKGKTISLGQVHYRNEKENVWARYTATRGISKFDAGSEVPSRYFITPNTAVPANYFLELEGFDEKISAYGGEDMEFGHRIDKEFRPKFIFNPNACVETVQDKNLDEALNQLREYGATGLPYIVNKHPELNDTYWVNRIGSKKIGHLFFRMFTRQPFVGISKMLLSLSPFGLKKGLINHLVVSAVHAGFRSQFR